MSITPKKFDERYEELVRWQTKLVRGMTEPPSMASRIYPHLPTDDQRRETEKRKSQQRSK
jgi:hypothetical protein